MATTTATTHRISWWAIANNGDGTSRRIRRNHGMSSRDWGFDVTCDCGWETHTGGTTDGYLRWQIKLHKWGIDAG